MFNLVLSTTARVSLAAAPDSAGPGAFGTLRHLGGFAQLADPAYSVIADAETRRSSLLVELGEAHWHDAGTRAIQTIGPP